MTLQECVAYALENAPAIRRARLEARQSALQIELERRKALPSLDLNSRLVYNFANPVYIAPGDLFGETDGDKPIRFGKDIEAGLGIELAYPIFDRSLMAGKDAPGKVQALSELQEARSREETALEVAKTYVQALTVREKGSLLQANLDRVNALASLTEKQVRNGFAKPSAIDRLRVAKSNLEVKQRNLDLQYLQLLELLKYRMAMPLDEDISLRDSLPEDIRDLGQQIENAPPPEQRNELKLLELRDELNLIKLERIRAEASPDIYLWGGVDLVAWGDNPAEWINTDYWYGSSFFGLRLDYPLLDGPARRTRMDLVRIEQSLAAEELTFAQRSLELQQNAARTSLQVNLNELESMRDTRDLSESFFELTQKEYEQGLTPFMELLSAETAMREAQSNYLSALLDIYTARLEWWHTRGELLDKLNLSR